MTPAEARLLALGFEGATERDHHGRPSFRRRTIFATLPDDQHLRVMLPEEGIREAVAESPTWCAESWWGRKLAAVQVTLADASPELVAEMLGDAWDAHG
ncbi:MmcQ/YjbR family DNA-binding protein [Nocardia sp. GTS18]|uniref:MmcQ/YjbR family DNA-binding protein n=1 Tax=Nocardia sp. GTS18 TaxID=1778064 RepID=UPI0015EFBA00|nr:MmcQ/YjbR family DNA-binding protein [Nocardia sp. GTS18]